VRVVATADLHYEFEQYRPRVDALAEEMCRLGADVLVVAGDTFAGDTRVLEACLRLFEGFRGEKLLVAGNHDLWAPQGDSFRLYDHVIPEVAARCGFHDLDIAPRVVGGVGFVGTVGWYDYSFRDPDLGVPMRFYEAKVAPGYAAATAEFRHLLDPAEQLPPQAMRAASMWMDGRMIRWDFDDPAFDRLTIERLRGQLEAIEPHVETIVVVTHHIPFAEMLTHKPDPSWTFGNAFMGSVGLGEAILECPRVAYSVFGHSHAVGRRRIGHLEAINIGSTYKRKRYELIEL